MHVSGSRPAPPDGADGPEPAGYLLQQTGATPLRSVEHTTGRLDGEPDSVLSRSVDGHGTELVVESRRTTSGTSAEDVATTSLARWLVDRYLSSGEIDRRVVSSIWAGAPDDVQETSAALVLDGVPAAGVVARRDDAVARVVLGAEHSVAVVHPASIDDVPRLVPGVPHVG